MNTCPMRRSAARFSHRDTRRSAHDHANTDQQKRKSPSDSPREENRLLISSLEWMGFSFSVQNKSRYVSRKRLSPPIRLATFRHWEREANTCCRDISLLLQWERVTMNEPFNPYKLGSRMIEYACMSLRRQKHRRQLVCIPSRLFPCMSPLVHNTRMLNCPFDKRH